MKRIIRELTPPVIWRFEKAAIRSMRRKTPGKGALIVGEERDADWYDQSLLEQEHYRVHYTKSNYYFWCVIADRIMRDGVRSILDIGCGPGQVACLLRDRGVGRYHGVDFSEKRAAQARLVCPEYTFSVEDVLKTDTVNTLDYDAALLMEVLEHLEKDVELLMRIPPGRNVTRPFQIFRPWPTCGTSKARMSTNSLRPSVVRLPNRRHRERRAGRRVLPV